MRIIYALISVRGRALIACIKSLGLINPLCSIQHSVPTPEPPTHQPPPACPLVWLLHCPFCKGHRRPLWVPTTHTHTHAVLIEEYRNSTVGESETPSGQLSPVPNPCSTLLTKSDASAFHQKKSFKSSFQNVLVSVSLEVLQYVCEIMWTGVLKASACFFMFPTK